ncbi:MAG: DUF3891 family protein [Candidatus Binataceae bacterium]|nr:DUF3891 family protein [Candidatus Binataceae bacterium]
MIIRGEHNGEIVMVNQTDHSQLVGQLASHWGNSEFDAPRPYESVVRAAIYHDFGWLPYETTPGADPKTGKPLSFMQVGLQKSQLNSYRWVVDWMNEIDPYSALIICMHRTGLWRGRYGAIDHPTAFNLSNPPPDVAKFTSDNEQWQEQQKKSFDEKELRTNYRLMQVWDLLGLYFCCQDVCDDFVDPVPQKYSANGDRGVKMIMKPESKTRVAFSPYPFDVRPLKVQLRLKHLPRATFENDEDFRKGFYQARNEWTEFELV